MRAVWILVAVVGCAANNDDPYHVVPTGGGPSGNGTPDAPVADAPVGGDQRRVCVMSDPRDATSCAIGGADGLTVTLGTATATTTADGSFTMTLPTGSNLVWRVTGPAIVPSVMPYSAALTIPAISQARFLDFTLDNGVTFDPGEGAAFVRILRAGAPVVGATVAIDPASASAVFYDGSSARTWDQDVTGAYGVAWIPDAIPTTSAIAVTLALAATTTISSVPIEEQAITFVTVEVP
ncbi:MAG: hypothetical protein NT062_17650 [Proteobacteria bacterium]|nr:hypothetical protein [Pseudomonadota bacterium]